MAQGTVTMFNSVLDDLMAGTYDFKTAAFKIGLIKSAANGGDDPAQADVTPHWGAGGSTNFKTAEVTPGGNYAADGPSIVPSVTVVGAVATFVGGDINIGVNASNPTNARWGIVYETVSLNAVCYLDLGSDFDMTTGDLDINTPNEWFTITIT